MSSMMPPPTHLGPFVLGDALGGNGMAINHTGVHQADGVEVVITMIETHEVDPSVRAEILKQVEQVSFRNFAHVLRPYQWGEDKGWFWCAWRRLQGDHAGRLMRTSGIPPIHVSLELARQTVLGLQELESAGLHHGVLSPASVFIDNDAHVSLLHAGWGRILDGIAGRYLHPAWMSVLPFTAPEVAAGGPATAHGDAYSLGAILYFLFLGRPTHWADDPADLLKAIENEPIDLESLAQEVPPPVAELVEELLSREPEDRPVNWPAMAQRIAVCIESAETWSPGAAPPEGEAAPPTETQDIPRGPGDLLAAETAPAIADGKPGPGQEPGSEPEPEFVDPRFAGMEDTPEESTPYSAPGDGGESGPVDGEGPGAGILPRNAIGEYPSASSIEPANIPRSALPLPAEAFRHRNEYVMPEPEAGSSDAPTAKIGLATPPPAPPKTSRDSYGVGEADEALATAFAPRPKQRAAPSVESTGLSSRAIVVVVVGFVVVLVACGAAWFFLMGPGSASGPAKPAGGGAAQATPAPTVPKDPKYTATANSILAFGRFVQMYKKINGRFPATFAEMRKGDANPIDAWGTPLDLREGFVVSAGKDKKWDTRDDIFFDPQSALIGGYVEAIDLPDDVLAAPEPSTPADSGANKKK